MLAKQNQYTINMVVYAATLKAHYAYYVQTWNKSGKREYSIEPSLYAVKSFIESKGINADSCMRCYKWNAFYVNEIVKIQQKYYLNLKAAKNAGSDEFKKVFKNRERLV